MPTEDQLSRWSHSRRCLRAARAALNAGDRDESLRLFTQAHDLGDDHTWCHACAHFGRARIEMRQGSGHDAAVDLMFGILAAVFSPLRRLRGVRGRGFGTEQPRPSDNLPT